MGIEIWKRQIIYSNATFSIIANSILLIFICKFSKPHMGNYKILMASFACFDIYFSIVQVITVPGNHFEIEYLGLTLYCCAYAMCLILLTYHFIYRYLLICNQHFMYLFNEKKYFLCWYIVWIFLAFLWGLAIRLSMYHWPQFVDYVRVELLKEYGVHVDQSGIIGPLYFLDGPNGTLKISWRAFLGAGFCVFLMGCCFSAILFCGLKVYMTLEKSSMSEKTKKLQWDLFKALLVQFSVPAFCEFLPGGLNFICPIFAIPLGRWANYSGIIASLNNIIEPLCMLYFVKDYRYVLLKILRLPHFRSQVYHSSDVNQSQAQSHADLPIGTNEKHFEKGKNLTDFYLEEDHER